MPHPQRKDLDGLAGLVRALVPTDAGDEAGPLTKKAGGIREWPHYLKCHRPADSAPAAPVQLVDWPKA